MAKRKVITTPIPSIDTQWDDGTNAYSGEAVEAFIKEQLKSKQGAVYFDDSEDAFITVVTFRSEADKAAWLLDKNNDSYVLNKQSFQVASRNGEGTTYVVALTAKNTGVKATTMSKKLIFPLRFTCKKATTVAGQTTIDDLAGISGTIVVTARKAGSNGSYTKIRPTDGKDRYIDALDLNSADFTNFDLGPFLQDGQWNYRISVVEPEKKTASSSVSVTVNLSTELRLQPTMNYYTPMFANTLSGFPISYTVYGTVEKTLHVVITGHGGIKMPEVTYTLGADVDSMRVERTIMDSTNVYGLLRHGVRGVKAWLTCDDGQGGELISNICDNQYMMINSADTEADFVKPHLLLQNVITQADNYAQTKLMDYAVFSPSIEADGTLGNHGKPVSVVFYLTNYSEQFPSPDVTEYFRIASVVSPGTANSLTTTIELDTNDTEVKTLNSYLRIWRETEDGEVDFMSESGGQKALLVSIDNSDSFAPKSGADFMLNPKIRNNSESNPAVIMNSKKNNAVIESTWKGFNFQTDGWVTSDIDGQKILHIPAGASVNFKYNPFAQFLSTADSGMTLEMDFMVRNVTNEVDPIVSIFETIAGHKRGLVLKPLTGNIFTKNNTIGDETDFSWREDVRTHITININNSISPDLGDALAPPSTATNYNLSATTIALCRVFVNDNIQREIKYSITDNDEFCTGLMSNGGITLGQKGCDLDIYSIRCYTHAALNSHEVLDNYISTLPTTEAKREMKTANSLITGGKIDINKVCPTDRSQPGKRALIWHGKEPFHQNTSAMKGWLEIVQYDNDGKYLPEYSGTICKATKSMKTKRQGSTANTYYYSNIQWKLSDIVDTIVVPVTDFHESIVVSAPYSVDIHGEGNAIVGTKMVVDIYGGNLGKHDPVEAKPQQYDYTDKGVVVPDGWIDGNGKYRGKGYMVAKNTPLASKLVNKINYASSMQGHLTGVNNLYNDLHKVIVGENSLQKACKTARVSKYTEPFVWFTQADDATSPVYRGPCTFGAGKMDKPTWGYVKKLHPMFYMIEGSDNNAHLTDARVPFVYNDPTCSESINYKGDDEGFFYNGIQGLDFDAGATNNDAEKSPKVEITNHIKEAWNFLYRHSPMIAYYHGTFDAFQKSEAAKNTTRKYWCTEGSDAYLLKRYDYKNSKWVDAGDTWNGTAWSKVDVRTDTMTASVYSTSSNKANFAALNNEFIGAIVAHAKKYLGFYFRVDSLKLYYTFVIHLLAGTDSCSKNTYFVCDPKAVSVTIDNETRECYLLEMHTDDVDTVLPIDNNGRGTKKYYIDRMHPYNDEDLTTNKYEGANNILFNLCEMMWEDTRELQNMMQRIFTAMCDLVQESDTIIGLPDSVAKKSVMGCLWKYIYSVMKYFPAVAFNEAARIRYEYPEMLGFISSGPGARGIRPITQSNGNLLECELQFIARRLIYMGTYAAWGPFKDGKTGNIGISDASGAAQIQAFHLPGEETSNVNYTFKVKPHQYLYPVGMNGQTNIDPHVRVAPGEEFELNLGNTTSNDTGLSVLAAHYLTSLGNLGDLSTNPNLTFTVSGKRLTEFKAVPSKTYKESGGLIRPAFRPQNIKFDAQNLRSIEITGMTGTSGELALGKMTRLETLKANNTGITSITLPKTTSLQTLNLPSGLSRLELVGIPSLNSFSIDGVANLQNILVDGATTGKLDTFSFVGKLRSESPHLKSMSIKNINWPSLSVDMLMWCASIAPYSYGTTTEGYSLTGSATIHQTATDRLTYAYKKKLIEKYGNIDAASGVPLALNYDKAMVNGIYINGKSYISATGITRYNIGVTPAYANNIAIVTDNNGKAVPDVRFSFVDDNGIEATPSQYCNWEDAVRGLLNVTNLTTEGNGRRYTLRAKVGVITGGKRKEIEADLNVAFYVRHPKVGDFAYADGTFDDQFHNDKTIVGMVFKRESMYQGEEDHEPTIYDGFNIPSDDVKKNKKLVGYRLLIDCKEYAVIKSKDSVINTSEHVWGLYPEGSSGVYSSNGFPIATTGAHIKAATSINNVYGTDMPLVDDGFSARTITTTSFYDKEREDGFKEFSGNVIANSWNGHMFTRHIVLHMEKIFKNFLMDSANEDVETVWNEAIAEGKVVTHTLNTLPTNLEELGDMMEILQKANGDLAIFRQFAYPAGYSCYLYEPTVRADETLDPQYAKHKWYLPAIGELMRKTAFFLKSRTGGLASTSTQGQGTVPNRSKIDTLLLEAYNSKTSSFIRDNVSKEHIEAGTYTTAEISKIEQWFQNLQECDRPIYSMILWRSAVKGGRSAFVSHSADSHWSSCADRWHYSWGVNFDSGYVYGSFGKWIPKKVRPTVAYTFIL